MQPDFKIIFQHFSSYHVNRFNFFSRAGTMVVYEFFSAQDLQSCSKPQINSKQKQQISFPRKSDGPQLNLSSLGIFRYLSDIHPAAGLGTVAVLAAAGSCLPVGRYFPAHLHLAVQMGVALAGINPYLWAYCTDCFCAANHLYRSPFVRGPEHVSAGQRHQPACQVPTIYTK